MRELVVQHNRFVSRTLAAAGVPRSDLEDEVQRTFIAVAGRLDDIRDGAERSFLFHVARNTAFHSRRTHARRREVQAEHLPEWTDAHATTPEDLFVRQQTRHQLDAVLAGLDEALRAVFVLYEVEEIDTVEIARLLAIPRGTVASRLRRAREQLRKQAAAIELAWDAGLESATALEEPRMARRKSTSRLERALLAAGLSVRPSAATRTATLACLALR